MNAVIERPVEQNGAPGYKGSDDALVLALAMGCSVPEAAGHAGLSVSTAYRRLRDPAFKRAVSAARDDLLGQAVGRLLAVATEAIDALRANLSNKNPMVRNRAALGILSHMIRGVDSVELARRIEELEQTAP